MPIYPDSIYLKANIKKVSPRVLVETLYFSAFRLNIPDPVDWQISVHRDRLNCQTGSVQKLLSQIPEDKETPVGIRCRLKNDALLHILQLKSGITELFLDFASEPKTKAFVLNNISQLLKTLRTLCSIINVEKAVIERQGGGVECLPFLPVARARTYAVVFSEKDVNDSFNDPDFFWKAWHTNELLGDTMHLVVRAENAASAADFLDTVQESHWAMARTVKSGHKPYGSVTLLPEEKMLFTQGAPQLREVGYYSDSKELELTCLTVPDDHIRPYEIYGIYQDLRRGYLSDGSKIKTIRITFIDKKSAEKEKQPLLDVGAEVFYFDDKGEYVKLTDQM